MLKFATRFVIFFALANVISAQETAPGGRVVPPHATSPDALGSLANDLVYTPVTPCRIADTQQTAAGPIASAATRSFVGINASSFTSQGGSNTNCGTLGVSATALMLTVTAVTPAMAGYAIVYSFGTTRPDRETSLQYAAGSVTSSAVMAKIPNPLAAFDFTIFSLFAANFVVDIVGYFAPPVATPLSCVTSAQTSVSIVANGTGNAVAPACPTGYTPTSVNCETTSWLMPLVFASGETCSARNNDSATATLRASQKCCRVPGR